MIRFRFVTLLLTIMLSACATQGMSAAEQRQYYRSMSNDVLEELYASKQSARAEVKSAPGYAVFSNANVNLILASFAGGYGIVRDNSNGQTTYMKMGEVGVGLGAGVKDYRVVFVFHDKATLASFIDSGWTFGGQADAAAKASDKGAAVGGEGVVNNISVYQMTKNGLALQATVKGTKYWRDSDLN